MDCVGEFFCSLRGAEKTARGRVEKLLATLGTTSSSHIHSGLPTVLSTLRALSPTQSTVRTTIIFAGSLFLFPLLFYFTVTVAVTVALALTRACVVSGLCRNVIPRRVDCEVYR